MLSVLLVAKSHNPGPVGRQYQGDSVTAACKPLLAPAQLSHHCWTITKLSLLASPPEYFGKCEALLLFRSWFTPMSPRRDWQGFPSASVLLPKPQCGSTCAVEDDYYVFSGVVG
ncbi:hypothetical protein PWT90_05020 [Aphanocladium album]|nr:hypothetical protein PWT90_05020 [Aphanocladium album]